LDNVGKFMGEEPFTTRTFRFIITLAEENVRSGGKGAGVEGATEAIALGIMMNPHLSKVKTKGIFHGFPHGGR
jgi:hypothetical protein